MHQAIKIISRKTFRPIRTNKPKSSHFIGLSYIIQFSKLFIFRLITVKFPLNYIRYAK